MNTLAKPALIYALVVVAFTSNAWAGASVEYDYDDYGNCIAVTTKDSGGDTLEKTTYKYDDYRRLITMVEAAHTTAETLPPYQRRRWDWVYDRYFDGPGTISSLAHTSKKWRVQIEPAYDATGNRRLSAQKFDYNDQIIEVATGLFVAPNGDYMGSPDTELHFFSYDANGNKESFTDPRGRVTTYEYDLRNRLKKTIEPLNRITETVYDTTGNKTDVTFPDTRSQHWRNYDAFGQAWTFIDERNNTTSLTYQWGPMKKLQTVTTYRDKDGGGTEPQSTTFYYTGLGLPQTTVFPDGSEEWRFYEFGQLKSFWTRKDQIKIIDYDARGREVSHTWLGNAAPGISRSWDDANRVSTLWNDVSTIDFDYDGAGLVWKEENAIAGSGGSREITFQRYQDGSLAEIKYPNGMLVRREYTARAQLKSVSDNNAGSWQTAVNYTYLPDGKVNYADHGDNTRTEYDYDGRGFTSFMRTFNRGSGQEIWRRNYYRDDRDRISAIQRGSNNPANQMENGRGDHFWYDAEGQLTDAYYGAVDPVVNPNSPGRIDYFVYDALGNRKGSNHLANRGWMNFTRKDNGLNQYRAWWNYSIINYDDDISGWGSPGTANGVIMQDGWITAGFNALNQPMYIWAAPSGWINFGFDPLGRCVKRWTDSWASYFYYEGWNLIQEGPNATTADRQYIHGAGVDEIVKQVTPGNGWERYFHHDARSHCAFQTVPWGDIIEQYDYDAFGKPYFYDQYGNDTGYSPWGNRFLFTGREYLSDLKLYDYRHRMYQPELGRFLQPDPKQFEAGDYNLYRYCHNDPVNKTDPDGQLAWFLAIPLWMAADWAYDNYAAEHVSKFVDDNFSSETAGNLRAVGNAVDVGRTLKNPAKLFSRNITKVFPTRKAALEARPKPLPAKPGQPRVTNQTRNKDGTGNKMKTDRGSQTPHVHDRNHNDKTKDNIHYRVGSKKIHPGDD